MPPNNSRAPIRVGMIGYGLAVRVLQTPFIEANPSSSLDLIVTSDPGRAAIARREHPDVNIVAIANQLAEHDDAQDLVVLAGGVRGRCGDGRWGPQPARGRWRGVRPVPPEPKGQRAPRE